MELKVWVDGVVRVVCGLSQETSCQDVVIALAQAIGQTGRYVLIQRLRDTERQLLANERPLESLAKLGQHSNEVQFFLRRTGPSSSDSPATSSSSSPSPGTGPPSERSFTLPRPTIGDGEPPRRREPKKSLTFNLGPSTSPRAKPKPAPKSLSKEPTEQKVARSPSPSPGPATHSPSPTPPGAAQPTKEEVFRHVLQQQERLAALNAQLEALECESRAFVQPSPTAKGGDEPPILKGELDRLEETLQRNQAELVHENYWQEEFRIEVEHEHEMRRRLGELHAKLDDCGRRLQDFNERADRLELELQREKQNQDTDTMVIRPGASPEESLGVVKVELQSQQRQGVELEAELSETECALGKAESMLQERQEELEELNKELRQCNLQQFIQQAGAGMVVAPPHTGSHSDLSHHLEQHMELAQLLQERYNMTSPHATPLESPPRPTAKHFLGHPRNLQNPLVSSLNPEGVYV